jgi:ribosome-associated protein
MKKLTKMVINALEEIKAQNITSIDVHKISTITDKMIIATGTSTRHVHAIASNVVKMAKEQHQNLLGVEGEQTNEWILIDLGDIIVHVMLAETREFYALEKLWALDMFPQAIA